MGRNAYYDGRVIFFSTKQNQPGFIHIAMTENPTGAWNTGQFVPLLDAKSFLTVCSFRA